MKTSLPVDFLATDQGREADSILRACVHCGFCTATCPTYQVLGNELDSPRGRIYLIKAMLEGEAVTEVTRTHLDRCLSCQACETTCPSGVEYSRLLDIGRAEVEVQVPRPVLQQSLRWLLRQVMPHRQRFTPLLRIGQVFRGILPSVLRQYVPKPRDVLKSLPGKHPRKVILVQGCVQPGLSPNTNAATVRVLDRLGIEALIVSGESCCGALSYHLNAQAEGLDFARRNIDAWWPLIEAGAEAVVMTATGCSNFVQDYERLLKADPVYAARAGKVVGLLKDISQVLAAEDLASLAVSSTERISWHCPCTAQHGQKLDQPTRDVLGRLGFELPVIADAHLCCGSAGTNSLLQPAIAEALRSRKLDALQISEPDRIVTANIGCQTHLAAATETPVVHWIELIAGSMGSTLHEVNNRS
jgi:glycolate oxidase iron-sulfur subunit